MNSKSNFQLATALQSQRLAFHAAGHAAAIYLNNKVRNLPPVFFQIVLTEINNSRFLVEKVAHLEGGCLIEYLPVSTQDLVHKAKKLNITTDSLMSEYSVAIETDIINLLVGSIAEAKYVANNDAEDINQYSINMSALSHYGGNSVLTLLNDYFQNFFSSKREQKEKTDTFFLAAFNFIDNTEHWCVITKIAHYLLNTPNNVVSYQEISALIEPQNKRILMI